MATTSGTVAGFVELCEAIRNFVTSPRYDESLGTGDGITKTYSATLSNPTVAKGQCRIRFKIAGVWYECWDDGDGGFDHAKIVSATSSLTYASGALAVEFTDAPDDATAIPVVYTDGSVEGQDWLPLLEQKSQDDAGAEPWPTDDLTECILKNSGASYKDFIAVGMRDWQYPAESLWSIEFNIFDHYDKVREDAGLWMCNGDFHSLTSYDATRGYWSSLPHVPLRDDTMNYWISSSKSRIQVVVRVTSTVYLWFWLGAGVRCASPSHYPTPNVAIGAGLGAENYSASTIGFLRSYMAINPAGEHTQTIAFEPFANFTCPHTAKKTTNSKIAPDMIYVKNIPVGQDEQNLMILDGIVWAVNNELTTEDTITDGAKTYLVFQNAYRTAYTDYFAMLLE